MTDIVHQLREMAGPIVPNVCTMAADEIERLRARDLVPKALVKLRALKAEAKLKEALTEIERLRAGGCARDQRTTQYCAEAVRIQAEIERIRKERDEARLAYCREVLVLYGDVDEQYRLDPAEVARRKGWSDIASMLSRSASRPEVAE